MAGLKDSVASASFHIYRKFLNPHLQLIMDADAPSLIFLPAHSLLTKPMKLHVIIMVSMCIGVNVLLFQLSLLLYIAVQLRRHIKRTPLRCPI